MEDNIYVAGKEREFKLGDEIFVCLSNHCNSYYRREIDLWLFEIRQIPYLMKLLTEGINAKITAMSPGECVGVELIHDVKLQPILVPWEYILPSKKYMN